MENDLKIAPMDLTNSDINIFLRFYRFFAKKLAIAMFFYTYKVRLNSFKAEFLKVFYSKTFKSCKNPFCRVFASFCYLDPSLIFAGNAGDYLKLSTLHLRLASSLIGKIG